jgi:hypothetical protein
MSPAGGLVVAVMLPPRSSSPLPAPLARAVQGACGVILVAGGLALASCRARAGLDDSAADPRRRGLGLPRGLTAALAARGSVVQAAGRSPRATPASWSG